MTDPEDPVMVLISVTCRTEGCGNAGIALQIYVPEGPDPAVICGVCSQPISDIQR